MTVTTHTNSKIEAAYRAMTPRSAEMARQATLKLPSGLAHDSRHMWPYGIYTDHAERSRKWDVDDNNYVDYYGGHGAMLLGHGRHEVKEAVQRQMEKGTHFGTCHELELRWSALIQEMVPSAERVRFHSSGTEATHMAIRLARAFTGRSKIVRFYGHFHGWHDHVAFGIDSHFDGTPSIGINDKVAQEVILVPPHDVDRVRQVLEGDGDVAAVMIEPIGSNSGKIPATGATLRQLQEVTRRNGVLLIFDEVVTGFRVSPGGAQAHYGVVPDITALAKIVAGGLPGGAVCGRKDILDYLDFEVSKEAGREKVRHQGTFNANPVSAAAGVAALEIIQTGEPGARAATTAKTLRAELNGVLVEEGVPWAIYGEFSIFHIFTNPQKLAITPGEFDATAYDYETFAPDPRAMLLAKLRLGMLIHGVDLKGWRGGFLSAVHDDDDIQRTTEAWRKSLRMLKEEGELDD